MKKCLGVIVAAVCALGLSACTKDDDSGRVVQCENGHLMDVGGVGIIGGDTLNSESWLAKGLVLVVTRLDSKTMEACTGSLLGNNIVLTAAHCVHGHADPKNVRVAFSVDPVCQIASQGRSDLLKKADAVVENQDYSSVEGGSDLALIHFSSDAPEGFHAMTLATQEIAMNPTQDFFVSGYGKETDYNDTADNQTRLKVAPVKVYRSGLGHQALGVTETQSNAASTLVFDQRNGVGTCAGDSGGPALAKVDGHLVVVGVASRVTGLDYKFEEQNDVTCKQGSVYTSVYFYRDWISTHVQQLQMQYIDQP